MIVPAGHPESERSESKKPQEFDDLLEEMWRDADGGKLHRFSYYAQRCPSERRSELEQSYVGMRQPVEGEWESTLSFGGGLAPEVESLPRQVGRYVLEERLLGGAQGRIYRARDPELDRAVVLKTVKIAGAALDRGREALERLREEARIGGALHHPNLCPVLDVVTAPDEELLYVVMPFIAGEPLTHLIERAREEAEDSAATVGRWLRLDSGKGSDAESASRIFGLPRGAAGVLSTGMPGELPALLRLVETIARAVQCLHAAGIVHRDLKPGNVIVTSEGQPMVLDFGLALVLDRGDDPRRTIEGMLLGTPAYMAPEQAEGRVRDVDARTDVWALGVLLFELLTLQRPFVSESRTALLDLISRADPPLPRKLEPRIPPDLEAVCLKCLERDPGRRYAHAGEVADELEALRLLRPVRARRLTRFGRSRRWLRRNTLATVIVLLIVGLAGVLAWREFQRGGRDDRLATVTAHIWAECSGDPAAAANREHIRSLFHDPRSLDPLIAVAHVDFNEAIRQLSDLVRGDAEAASAPAVFFGGSLPVINFRTFADSSLSYRVKVESDGASVLEWECEAPRGDREVRVETRASRNLPKVASPCRMTWRIEVMRRGRPAGLDLPSGSFVVIPPAMADDLEGALGDPVERPEDSLARARVLMMLGRIEAAHAAVTEARSRGDESSNASTEDLLTFVDALRSRRPAAQRVIQDCWMVEETDR